jgi:hypothetical protein
MLCSRGDLNSESLHTIGTYLPRRLKVKRQWTQRYNGQESTLYRDTVEMLLQCNSELALTDLRYSEGLLYMLSQFQKHSLLVDPLNSPSVIHIISKIKHVQWAIHSKDFAVPGIQEF